MRMVTAGWMAPLRSRALRRIHRRMKSRRAALEAGRRIRYSGSTTGSVSSGSDSSAAENSAADSSNNETMVHITATARNITVRAVEP